MVTWQMHWDTLKQFALAKLTVQHCCATNLAFQHYFVQFLTICDNSQFLFSSIAHTMQCEQVTKTKKLRHHSRPFLVFCHSLASHVVSCEQNKRDNYLHTSHTDSLPMFLGKEQTESYYPALIDAWNLYSSGSIPSGIRALPNNPFPLV